jgi:hypothetical protein
MALVNSDRCRVRLGSMVAFEDVIARLSKAAAEKKYDRPWTAYQTLYGAVGNISFITLHESWKDLAQQAPPATIFEDLFGAQQGRTLFAEANACLDEVESIVAVDRPELSYSQGGLEQPAPFMQFTQIRARAGAQEECEELMRKVAEAIPKVDDPTRFTAWQTLMGDRQTYGVSFPLAGLADLDGRLSPADLLQQAFGSSEGSLIYRQGRQAISELRTSISVYREDLSNRRP